MSDANSETTPGVAQRIVVIGSDSTSVRLAEELARAGEQVAVLADGSLDASSVADLRELGAEVFLRAQVRAADLRAAGVEQAKAVVILGDDDVRAIRIALLADELAPDQRTVIEMTNPMLAGTISDLIGDCVLLSSAELAAPAFVAAALATPDTSTFEIGGRMVAVGPREQVGGDLLAVIGDSRKSGVDAVLPPGLGGDIVLGTKLVSPVVRTARTSGVLGGFSRIFDRRARLVLLGLVLLIVLSTLYFHFGGSGWLTSLYLALTSSTATGDGDLGNLPVAFRFGAVAIQLFGLILSAGITAVVVDALIGARLAAITGGVRGKPRHHVVVCGLGRVGTSAAARIQARGVPVVAIEQREDAAGVLRARQLKIPIIIAPATDAAAQAVAGINRAAAVLAVTDDEAVNLEIALVAKNANPGVRAVIRLFEHDLAERVEQRMHLGATRSVSMLAAPAFAAAALGRRREVIFPIGRRVLLFTEVIVSADSAAPGTALRALVEPGTCLLLAWSPMGRHEWHWNDLDRLVSAGDQLAVVATRSGLARLLRATKSPTRGNGMGSRSR